MKTLSKISALLFLSLIMVVGANAQPKSGTPQQKKMMYQKKAMLPDLTDAQQEQMKTIRLSSMKKMQPLKNSLMEKKAHLRTLSTAQNTDMKAINKQIDEISTIQASMQKLRASSKQEVRALLTEDQRIVFDSKQSGMKGKGNCMKDGNGPQSKMRKGGSGSQWN